MNGLKSSKASIAHLESRGDYATVCPGEVARSLAEAVDSPDWRGLMPEVHKAVDDLLSHGLEQLSWKENPPDRRVGPYRIRWRQD